MITSNDLSKFVFWKTGVQNLFLDAIEGDGTALLSADMLYPDHSMRESALQHSRRHFKGP